MYRSYHVSRTQYYVSHIPCTAHTAYQHTVNRLYYVPRILHIPLYLQVTDASSGYKAIHFYDWSYDWVYFTSTEDPNNFNEGLPRIRHVWRVKGADQTSQLTRLFKINAVECEEYRKITVYLQGHSPEVQGV